MEIILEIKTKSSEKKCADIYAINDIFKYLRNLKINDDFEFFIYKRNKSHISEFEVLTLKNSNGKLLAEYSNQNAIVYTPLTLKNIKEFEVHIFRFVMTGNHINESEIFFKKLTNKERIDKVNYGNWKKKYLIEKKKEQKRNLILVSTVLLFLITSIIYIYTNTAYYKFKYEDVKIVKAEIFQIGWAPIGRGLNRQYVVYKFKYKGKYYTGSDRTGRIILGFGKGEKKPGDIINIKFIESEPSLNKIY